MLATEPLSVDQHLKVVREATWEARAKWKCLGEELGVTMGKLEVKIIVIMILIMINYNNYDVLIIKL